MAAGSADARRIALIVNTRSRSGQRGLERACRLLNEMGRAPVMARAVDDPRKLQGAVAQALAGGCDRLVVGGGDGTISCAAGQLATSGRRDESAEVKSWRARRVFIDACPSQLVAADGEIIGRTPIHVEVVPGALRLVRPANLPRHSGRD